MNEFIPAQSQRTVDFTVSGCNDMVEFDAGDVAMLQDGKLLSVDVTLKSVCPGKRVALATLLSELDSTGAEQRRGMRCMTVSAQTGDQPCDIAVRGIRFVLPADISLSSGNVRRLRLRFICHYIDSDINCMNFTI